MNTKFNLFKTMRVALIVFALTFSTNMNAATPNPAFLGGLWNWLGNILNHKHYRGCGHGNQGGGDAVPLDGGLGILLVGAAAFGVKKLRENRNEEA